MCPGSTTPHRFESAAIARWVRATPYLFALGIPLLLVGLSYLTPGDPWVWPLGLVVFGSGLGLLAAGSAATGLFIVSRLRGRQAST